MYNGATISKSNLLVDPSLVPPNIQNIPMDSIHPISGIYKANAIETNETNSYIRIQWNDPSIPISYFNVEWLNRHRYHKSNSEVTPTHCITASSCLDSFTFDEIMNDEEGDSAILHLFHVS
jgi:hypothetical protein